jgi:O-antigen biosynthesis protein WbqP
MKRFFDLIAALFLLTILFLPLVALALAVKITSKGPAIFWSDRVGLRGAVFKMPKFRSMLISTPVTATHLVPNPEKYLTPIGGFLRKTSLDELPQLYSILKGDMSLVGPRPALFNQYDLIKLRKEKKIDQLIPGITGWAQVNGRDDLTIEDKVSLDEAYLKSKSFFLDIKILFITFLKVIKSDGIKH